MGVEGRPGEQGIYGKARHTHAVQTPAPSNTHTVSRCVCARGSAEKSQGGTQKGGKKWEGRRGRGGAPKLLGPAGGRGIFRIYFQLRNARWIYFRAILLIPKENAHFGLAGLKASPAEISVTVHTRSPIPWAQTPRGGFIQYIHRRNAPFRPYALHMRVTTLVSVVHAIHSARTVHHRKLYFKHCTNYKK